METLRPPGAWLEETVAGLTHDESLREIFRAILERTIGAASDDINFPFDRYSAPDGIGRPEKAARIGHWLCLVDRTAPGLLHDPATASFLTEAGLDEIYLRATDETARSGFGRMLPPAEGDESTVAEYEDGCRIVALLRPEAVRNEFEKSRMPGTAAEGMTTWVLREPDGLSSAMLVIRGDSLVAMHGPRGSRVPYHVSKAYVLGALAESGISLEEPGVIHGGVQTADGRMHDLRELPAGSTVHGSLWIREEGRLISRLPAGLTVDGDFGLFDSPFITETPKGMKVSGDCGFVGCNALKKVSSGLSVGGWTYLEACPNLAEIGEGVDFGKGVMLPSGRSALAARPFRVGEIVIRGAGVNVSIDAGRLPRDGMGRVTIDGGYLRDAERLGAIAEIAGLPALAARVGYDALAARIRSRLRKLRPATRREDDSRTPPSPTRR